MKKRTKKIKVLDLEEMVPELEESLRKNENNLSKSEFKRRKIMRGKYAEAYSSNTIHFRPLITPETKMLAFRILVEAIVARGVDRMRLFADLTESQLQDLGFSDVRYCRPDEETIVRAAKKILFGE